MTIWLMLGCILVRFSIVPVVLSLRLVASVCVEQYRN